MASVPAATGTGSRDLTRWGDAVKAWVVEQYGEPEDVLALREIDAPAPNDSSFYLIDV